MGRIKGTKSDLLSFTNLICIPGELYPGETKSRFLEDFCIELDDGVATVRGVSENIAYEEVEFDIDIEEEGEIVVQNAEEFEKVLGRFKADEEINVEDTGRHLEIKSDRKEFKIKSSESGSIRSMDGIDNIPDINYNEEKDRFEISHKDDEIYLDVKAVVNAADLQEIVDDGSVIDTSNFPLSIEEDSLVVNLGNDQNGSFETEIDTVNSRGKAKTKIMYGLGGVAANLEGDIEIYTREDSPLVFRQKKNGHNVYYFVANTE